MSVDEREQRIRELAYSIWQHEGRPHGQAERHWQMAREAVKTLELAEVAVAMNADGVGEAKQPMKSGTQKAPMARSKSGPTPEQSKPVTRTTKPKPPK